MRVATLHRDQRGVASIMITMLLMVITSLIVLSFAQLARHEQRTALDNRLSTQAYYAAESGINDAKKFITSQPAGTTIAYNDCSQTNYVATSIGSSPQIGADSSVKYTCLMIDTEPNDLNGIASNQKGTVFRIKSVTDINGLKITWSTQAAPSLNGCPTTDANNMFTPTGTEWTCPFGVLRIELVKTDISPITRDSLIANTQTVYVVPRNGSVTPGTGWNSITSNRVGGRFLADSCDAAAKECSFTIDSSGGLSGHEYYMNTSLLYGTESKIKVSQLNNNPLIDSQATIDATGRAQDVLRRVKVSVNLFSSDSLGDSAIQVGDGVCKDAFVNASIYDQNDCPE